MDWKFSFGGGVLVSRPIMEKFLTNGLHENPVYKSTQVGHLERFSENARALRTYSKPDEVLVEPPGNKSYACARIASQKLLRQVMSVQARQHDVSQKHESRFFRDLLGHRKRLLRISREQDRATRSVQNTAEQIAECGFILHDQDCVVHETPP
jgi:hypothetical protein